MNLPDNLLYTKEHEWVLKEGSKIKVGITDFAQSELGDIVFVELPEVGDEMVQNEPFGSVESVKTVSELYSPVNGKVVEVNSQLEDAPEKVNDSPYDEGWMVVVEVEGEAEGLLSKDEYKAVIG